MPRGRNHGYKRDLRRGGVPYGFARKVYEVLGKSERAEAQLKSRGNGLASFSYDSGCDDSCIILPSTELVRSDSRPTFGVTSRGGGIRFEVTATRNWAIRIIGFHYSTSISLTTNDVPSDGDKTGTVWFDDINLGDPPTKKGYIHNGGVMSDPVSPGYLMLLRSRKGSPSILNPVADRTPFFYPVRRESKKRVFLDQVYRGGGSTAYVDVRPISAWVDYRRKLEFSLDNGMCWVGEKDNRADLFFAVIINIPSFFHEKVASALPAVSEVEEELEAMLMDTKPASESKGKTRARSASEASTVLLPGRGKKLPVLEISNVWARFYWRSNKIIHGGED